MSEEKTPFQEGRLAACQIRQKSSNPYPTDSPSRMLWDQGWEAGNFIVLELDRLEVAQWDRIHNRG